MKEIATLTTVISQVLLTVVTAIFVFVLVYRNRHLPLGRYDAILHLPVFGIPLVVLVVGAALDQIQPNIIL
jgi:ABC-type spermidine/putrescine transport system permease subunit II